VAKLFPEEARKVKAKGHTVGTHSFRHPFTFDRMSEAKADEEIGRGVEAVAAALGSPDEVAPFFRVPGLLTSKSTEAALASRKLMTWSTDFTGDDWKGISSAEIKRRAISRIEDKGRGILLLHDIHEQTVVALPKILSELKQQGYKIVQVVPANATVAKTDTTPEQWRLPLGPPPEPEQGHEQTAQPPATSLTQTGAPQPPEAGTGKLALAEESVEKHKRFATFDHRCRQLLGCGVRGCSRGRGAQPIKGDKDAYFSKSSGGRLGCSRVHRNHLSRRLSANELQHRRERHGNQDRQHYAILRTGIGLRSDRLSKVNAGPPTSLARVVSAMAAPQLASPTLDPAAGEIRG
jgi:hypothetical protein